MSASLTVYLAQSTEPVAVRGAFAWLAAIGVAAAARARPPGPARESSGGRVRTRLVSSPGDDVTAGSSRCLADTPSVLGSPRDRVGHMAELIGESEHARLRKESVHEHDDVAAACHHDGTGRPAAVPRRPLRISGSSFNIWNTFAIDSVAALAALHERLPEFLRARNRVVVGAVDHPHRRHAGLKRRQEFFRVA